MSKKKRRQRKKPNGDKSKSLSSIKYPKPFFKKIGIRPLINPSKENLDQILRTKFGSGIADGFWEAYESPNLKESWQFHYTNLELAKMKCGNDFVLLCEIAEQLKNLTVVPEARVLDIGGGAGHLAFWVANIWNAKEVCVADKCPELGEQWAKEIGETRAKFVYATLPSLNIDADQKYDIILMSRVLQFVDGIDLPFNIDSFSLDKFRSSEKTKIVIENLEKIAEEISKYLSSDGIIIVVQSWSDARLLLMGQVFEKKGLYINPNYVQLENMEKECFSIVFSKRRQESTVKDLPFSLATLYCLGVDGRKFDGMAAEAIRMLFSGLEPTLKREIEITDREVNMTIEVLEKDGLALFYQTSDEGFRTAVIASSFSIPSYLEHVEKYEINLSI